jgi:AAA domain
MLLVNLTGGPGSGKSTTAAIIFSELKMANYKAELVGEEARELIYDGSIKMLENQALILGQQWQRITRLRNCGADVAICDSPLSLSILYSKTAAYHPELVALVRKMESLIPDTFNIFVKRVKAYNTFGRYQDEEAAKALDAQAMMLIRPLHLTVTGDRSGATKAADAIIDLLKS